MNTLNPDEINKYYKYYISIVTAKKRYTEKNKEIINEKARSQYNENTEYKEKRKQQMREYMKRKKEQKLKENENKKEV